MSQYYFALINMEIRIILRRFNYILEYVLLIDQFEKEAKFTQSKLKYYYIFNNLQKVKNYLFTF